MFTFSNLFRSRSRRRYQAYKETARALILERVHKINSHYQLPIGRIAIRAQKSRWGSCSRKGNLNFNYKLIFLAPDLQDYIIVHEICHIKEFNHGAGFWKLVAEMAPDYRERRGRLRKM